MKRIFLTLTGFIVACLIFAQTPQAFKYQAVVRDNAGNLMTEQTVQFQIDILKGSTDGAVVYSESHSAATSKLGLVNLEVGKGTTSDDFSSIDWSNDSYFIRIWVNGDEMGTSQLLSVPYAQHAQTAEEFTGDEIKNIKDPSDDQDVATKAYVDRQITYPGIRIQGTVDSIDCYGDNSGAIDLTITGGTSPYITEWSNGETSQDLEALESGSYQVYVEDVNGMTAFRHFNLFNPEEIHLQFDKIDGGTGEIAITVNGGMPPYSYLWSNGSTEEDQSGLNPGVYTITVTDAAGCSTSQFLLLGGAAQQLAEYLESADSPSGGDYVNTAMPSIKSSESVKTLMATGAIYIIDIRSAADYAAGHIEGAVNVAANEVLNHIKGVDLSAYEEISIVDYTGQVSCWATCLLQLMGYNNVYAMKFGMASWHENFAAPWNSNISNAYIAQFVSDPATKGPEGELPVLTSVGETPQETLELRVEEVFEEGFGVAAISIAEVFANLDNYYIINYWPESDYLDPGHIPGAIQYTPKSDIALDNYLKTLPTNKQIVVYDYTGQNSASLVAYLRLLGYNAKSLKFGTNGMIYDEMTSGKWSAASIMGYDYVSE